ncbi:unnamed protein product [Closterium sp. NIES-64]|nr:unnamed protein product [Closterium sp. NIES-64]
MRNPDPPVVIATLIIALSAPFTFSSQFSNLTFSTGTYVEPSQKSSPSLDRSVCSSLPYFNKLIRILTTRPAGPDPYFNKLIRILTTRCMTQGPGPCFDNLTRILTTRCMTQAVYFPSGQLAPAEYHHYGLAAPIYTHFTSPIRRYADVVVHRLLAAAIGLTPLPDQTKDKTALTALTDNLNYRNRNAQMAGRASVELHTLIFFRTRPTDAEGRIVMVRSNGLIVFVPKYGIKGPVYLVPKEPHKGKAAAVAAANKLDGNAPSSDWVVDEKSQTVESKDGKRRFKVLDIVTVHIEVIEPQPNRPKLSLTLVSQ